MNTITFDTNKIVNRLQAKGFSKDQAEGVVAILSEEEFVNKPALEQTAEKIISEFKIELAKSQVTLMKWVTGVLIAQGAAIVALQNLIG